LKGFLYRLLLHCESTYEPVDGVATSQAGGGVTVGAGAPPEQETIFLIFWA